MKKRVLGWLLVVVALGCGDRGLPTALSISDRAAPVVSTDPGPAGIEYQLIAFDVATRTVTAESRLGSVCDKFSSVDPCRFRVSISLTTDSWIQPARTDRFSPVDPCRDLAVNYNTVVADVSIDVAIAALTSQGCNARIGIDQDAGTIRQFQPVP
jgi:hypothetical protein